MLDTVLAATLFGPYDLRIERYPYPTSLEPGAVLLRMLASGICGTDKHTYPRRDRAVSGHRPCHDHALPIIQGHENVGVVEAIGGGGASTFDGTSLSVGDRIVPAPNRHCRQCGYCTGDLPYYMCRHIETYGNSLTTRP